MVGAVLADCEVRGSFDLARGAWPSGNPIDWWFLAAPGLDATGRPSSLLGASLAANNLLAGPGEATLTIALGGGPAAMDFTGVHLAATINGSPPPNVPAPPPASLAAGLTVFQTMTGNAVGQGLCGGITVESLAQVPVPVALAQGGASACTEACAGSHGYTACNALETPANSGCNSLLDVLVGGCKVIPFACADAVNPTQPDMIGSGSAIQTLVLGSGNKVSASQTRGDRDAYSSYWMFTANRAHFTGETCSMTSECQNGLVCRGGRCQ